MIKEKKKKTKYSIRKTKAQVLLEYIRTIFISFLIAIFITTYLTFQARNDMIKDLTNQHIENEELNKQVAEKLIEQADLLKDLKTKNYSVCMHIAELFETVGDFKDSQMAYEYAVAKTSKNNYKPYLKLIYVLTEQEKFSEAFDIIDGIKDYTNKNLFKFKTRAYLTIGDKYYSIGKFLSAANSYEQAEFYYNKFTKKDSLIEESIKNRVVNAYIKTADIMVKNQLNNDAIRYLNKARLYVPKDSQVKYKLAIIYSDLDPEKSIELLDELLLEIPQEIDYDIFNITLMKAANLADYRGDNIKAKYYRYRIRSVDMFIDRKVVYKDEIEAILKSFVVKKKFFTYPLKFDFVINNLSNKDIVNLYADFVLSHNNKDIETITKMVSDKNNPLLSYDDIPNYVSIKFNKNVFTKKELENYVIKVYLYKDEKYKTLVCKIKVPKLTYKSLY